MILALALAVRVHGLNRQGLWMDEILSIELANGHDMHDADHIGPGIVPGEAFDFVTLRHAQPWWRVPAALANNVHPPGYYLALRWWCDCWGESETALRSLSLVLSLGSVLVLFLAVRLHADERVALWAALLLALAAPCITYAHEARPYAMLMLLGLLLAWSVLACEVRGTDWRALAGVCLSTCALLYTHYFCVWVLAAIAVYVACRLRGRARLEVLGALAAGVIFFLLLWGRVLWQQTESHVVHNSETSTAYLAEAPAVNRVAVWQRLAKVPAELLGSPDASLAYVGALFLLLPLVMVRRSPWLWLWLGWLWCVVVSMSALDLLSSTRSVEYVRYVLLAAPALCVCVAALNGCGRWGFVVPVVALGFCLWSLPSAYEPSEFAHWDQDFRGLARQLDAGMGPRDALMIVVADWPSWHRGVLYQALHYYMRRWPATVLVLDRLPSAEELQALRDAPTVWCVKMWRSQPIDTVVPGRRVSGPWNFANVGSLYQLNGTSP
jgi:hypothetical protein